MPIARTYVLTDYNCGAVFPSKRLFELFLENPGYNRF
jgi:hypothetical protein